MLALADGVCCRARMAWPAVAGIECWQCNGVLPFSNRIRICNCFYCFLWGLHTLHAEATPTADAGPEDSDPSRTFSVTSSGIRFKDLKIGDGPEVRC